MKKIIFENDNNVEIIIPDDPLSDGFCLRTNHEVLFRKISNYLISNSYIKQNIIDLGCWIGDNSIPWAKNIQGKVYAIDPSPRNTLFVKKLKDYNNLTNLIIIQKAITDRKKILSTNESLDHCSFQEGMRGQNILEATSLDELYDQKIINDISYIHLDVEGLESNVIHGSVNLINIFKPVIAFEQHLYTDNYKELSKFLNSKNYFIYLVNEILPGCRPDCRNFFAFPSDKYYENIIEELNNYLKINNLFTKIF